MSRWLRLHTEVVDDPKVQCLPPELFRAWINVLCIAGQNGGKLPDMRAVAFKLRMGEAETRKTLEGLEAAGLLDRTEEGFEPHAWKERQYQGATSTDRVKKHRAKAKDETPDETACNVSETFHETQSETKNETHQKQIQNRTDITSPLTREAEWTGLIKAFDEGLNDGAGRKVRLWPNPKDSVTAMRLHKAGVTPEIVKAIATGEAQSKVAQGREPATALAYIESRCIEALTSPPARASPSVPKMTGAELAAENERKRNAILARTN